MKSADKISRRHLKIFNFLKYIKQIVEIAYLLVIFFEKPYWCYDSFILSNPSKECPKNVIVIHNYHYPRIERPIQCLILVYFICLNVFRNTLRNETVTFKYRSLASYLIYAFMTIDLVISMFLNSFPFINFILRPFVFILISRQTREEWNKIIKVVCLAKRILSLIFISLLIFSFLGYLLLGNKADLTEAQIKSNDFRTFLSSLKSMFILLTAHFPAMMLQQFSYGRKWCFPFFLIYLCTFSYFLVGIVKAQYYYSYTEQVKMRLNSFFSSDSRHIFESVRKNKIGNKLNTYEFQNMLGNLNLTGKEKDLIEELIKEISPEIYDSYLLYLQKKEQENQEKEARKEKYSKFLDLSDTKLYEGSLSFINITLIILIVFMPSHGIIFQILLAILTLYYQFELYVHCYVDGLWVFIYRNIFKFAFFMNSIFYLLSIIVYVIALCLDYDSGMIEICEKIIKVSSVFFSLRVLFFLNQFNEYKLIFIVIMNMKSVFYSLFLTMFSFFLVFITFTMLIVGGRVTKEDYMRLGNVPKDYYYLNFNDFGFGFLTCITMMILTNMDVVSALSSVSSGILNIYFAIFYFVGVNLVLNVCQTYILSLYFNLSKREKSVEIRHNEVSLLSSSVTSFSSK